MLHDFVGKLLPVFFVMLVCAWAMPVQAETREGAHARPQHGGHAEHEMGQNGSEHGSRMEGREGQGASGDHHPPRPEQFSERHDGNHEFAREHHTDGPPPRRHDGPDSERGEGEHGGGRPPHGPEGGRGPEGGGGPGHGSEHGHGGGHGPHAE